MCVVSMIHDHYRRHFEPFEPWLPSPAVPISPQPWLPFIPQNPPAPEPRDPSELSPSEIAELRKLLREFRSAAAAAKRVDDLTAQPDCVDPEKARLAQRVAELAQRLPPRRPKGPSVSTVKRAV